MENDRYKDVLNRAKHLILVGILRDDVAAAVDKSGLQRADVLRVVDAAERFVLVRNLCFGSFAMALGILLQLPSLTGWRQSPIQVVFMNGFMGAVFVAVGLKFLFSGRSGVPFRRRWKAAESIAAAYAQQGDKQNRDHWTEVSDRYRRIGK
jgi:hypothetical protein